MKFFPGQRVRIRHDANAVTPDLERVKGEVCRVVGPYVARSGELVYELDLKFSGYPVLAGKHAIEPVFDKPEKISWSHSACVWKPREMDREPAVIRRNRRKEQPSEARSG